MLKINNLTKSYGSNFSVSDLSLSIPKGSICGFVGSNGSGKTTTMKAICGIHSFDSGEIFINGHCLRTEPIECKKQLAYVADTPDMYPFFTGIKYLNFIGDMYEVSVEQRNKYINEYADLFELTKFLGSKVSTYSHGTKQKLALVAALLHEPKLLLLDEPFVGLDPKTSRSVKNVMRNICEQGAAILFSTHILEVAENLCDQIAIIHVGKLVASGKIDDLRGNSSLEQLYFSLMGSESNV